MDARDCFTTDQIWLLMDLLGTQCNSVNISHREPQAIVLSSTACVSGEAGSRRGYWGQWLGPPFAPGTLPGRSIDNINGGIDIRVTHGDFVDPAAA